MLRLSGHLPPPDPSAVFTTLLAEDGRAPLWPLHRHRLEASAQVLFAQPLPDDADARLAATVAATTDRAVLRVTVCAAAGDPAAALVVEVTTGSPPSAPPVARALVGVAGRTGAWRHKWCDRGQLADAQDLVGAGREPLFVDDDGLLLETATASVAVLDGDAWLVPPASADVLPGVTQAVARLAAEHGGPLMVEAPLPLAAAGTRPMVTLSSVAGVVPVATLDGHRLPQDPLAVRRLRDAMTRTVRHLQDG